MSEEVTTPKKAKRERKPREKMPEQAPEARIHNFDEVPFGYTEQQAVAEAERCIICKKPKCVDGCPVNIDIPKFIAQIRDGDFLGAARTVRSTNSLPAICGRVCPQADQCEVLCVEGIKYEPVAIGNLERFIADWELANDAIEIPAIPPPTGYRIAVVGSGPAGLTVAGDMAKLGHEVTIYEALHRPSGVLVYGIPEFRLPRSVVAKEIDYIRQLGVKFVYDVIIGVTITVDELFEQGYHAVFIGTGAGLPKMMKVPGENLVGVYSANEFLTRVNLMGASREGYDTPIRFAKHTVVVGGGNTAMDAARVSLRVSGNPVTLVYRRSMEEIPARREEIHHAVEEGIKFDLLVAPLEVIGDDKGQVKAIKCIRMGLGEPDDSGRRRPVPIEGSEFIIDCDTVIVAIGNSPNPIIPRNTPGIESSKWGTIVADEETGATSRRGVYAGGDIVSGAATVILAMGAGRKAATAMDAYVRTLPLTRRNPYGDT
ncbi:NADPH-dependent glutamate synthase [bacterium]|nr:NADPH-dependent glutamate synthase [bacterium]MBU1985356.1 NADPH-dependent glutamate synthase [bacterium]